MIPCPIKAAPEGAARCSILDFVQITPLDEGNEFVPFSVRQPNGICVLINCDAPVGDLDLRAFRAVRAKGEFYGFHLDLLLDGSRRPPYSL